MPVILDDAMLVPPSLRRKNYNLDRDRIIELDSSSSTIEIPRSPNPPSRPVVIHEEIIPVERPTTEIITEREIIIDPGARGVRRYRGAEYRRGRARSLSNYDSYSESSYDDGEYYYLEDGTRHRHTRRSVGEGFSAGLAAGGLVRDRHRRYHDTRPRQRDPHTLRHLAEGAVIGGAVEHLRHRRRSSSVSSTSSDDSHHRARKLAGAGLAAAGAKVLYDRHRAHEREREGRTVIVDDADRHRHVRRIAEAGAGLAAAGVAKGLYDRHRRHRSRSFSSSRSRSRSRSRVGRHLAATAIGATAAGMAAHKMGQRRRGSWSSYSSSDDEHSHRGRKVLAGAATAAAAGIAAKRLADHRRHRSRSSSTSSDESSHKARNAALLGAAALAARHHHKKKQRSRSRSISRPGMLRRRSRTYSPPRSILRNRSMSRRRSRSRHRSSSRGAALAKAAAVTMAGALANKQRRRHRSRSRARSADAAAERRRRHMRGERRVHYHNDPHIYNGGSSASTIHPGSSVSNTDARGGRIRNAIMPAEGRSRRGSTAQDFAYKIGESVAEGLRRV